MDCTRQYGLFLILVFFIASNEGSKGFVIQTVQSDDGQTFDCFDINKQPALNHPSLKNHKIQMRPSSYPFTMNEEYSSSNSSLEVQMTKIPCPLGTIPILRNDQQDNEIFSAYRTFTNSSINNSEKTQVHIAKWLSYGTIYGTRVSISVYEPDVSGGKGYRFTGALFYISYGDDGILLGWMLSTEMGDNYVHLYAEWGHHGCINQKCPGFVQVHSDFAFGAKLRPVSTYNGEQYRITLSVFKDPKTGNWWLNYGKEGIPVGYWPKSIFKRMTDKATKVSWGGMATTTLDQPSPPMGSGQFAYEGFGKSAFYEDISIVNDKNQFIVPNSAFCIPINFNKKCYTISKLGMNKAGLGFFFGGPGGCRGL